MGGEEKKQGGVGEEGELSTGEFTVALRQNERRKWCCWRGYVLALWNVIWFKSVSVEKLRLSW